MYSEPDFTKVYFHRNSFRKKKSRVWRKLVFIQIGYKKILEMWRTL